MRLRPTLPVTQRNLLLIRRRHVCFLGLRTRRRRWLSRFSRLLLDSLGHLPLPEPMQVLL